jgi:hypothetical protein
MEIDRFMHFLFTVFQQLPNRYFVTKHEEGALRCVEIMKHTEFSKEKQFLSPFSWSKSLQIIYHFGEIEHPENSKMNNEF